jgi:hypothetical protein
MRVVIHAGTHKTGTTALQATLATRDSAREGPVFYPASCRGPGPGHQQLAWELLADPRHDPRRGTLAGLVAEMSARRAALSIVSAEGLQLLHADPGALRALEAALRSGGFTTDVVMYVRRRDHYAAALYAQLVLHRSLSLPFDAFMEAVLDSASFTHRGQTFRFAYADLAACFDDVFTPERVHLRAYVEGAEPQALVRDFLASVGADPAPFETAAAGIGRLHERAGIRRVAHELRSNAGTLPDERFHPIDAGYARRLRERFASDDERIAARFGVAWPHDAPGEAHASAERGARHLALLRAAEDTRAATKPAVAPRRL